MNPFAYMWEAISAHPFNALTLLIAAGATVYSGIQAMEARKTRKLNERLFEAQSEALAAQKADATRNAELAERSAIAAEGSASSARTLTEVGQRPWVNITNIKCHRENAGEILPSSVVTTVANGGQTPALRLVVFQSVLVSEQPFEPAPEYFPAADLAARGQLGPQGSFQTRTLITLEQNKVRDILAGILNLYLFGYASYEDVFGGHHKTTWCLIYNPDPRYHDFTYFTTNNEMT